MLLDTVVDDAIAKKVIAANSLGQLTAAPGNKGKALLGNIKAAAAALLALADEDPRKHQVR